MCSQKGRSLGNILSPSSLPPKNPPRTWLFQPGFYSCGANKCTLCKYASKAKEFVGPGDNQTYKIQHFLNCNSTFVVYVINCTFCNLRYVGCTKRPLKKRKAEHLADINHNRTNFQARPAILLTNTICHWDISRFMRLSGLINLVGGAIGSKKLHNREAYWILILQTRSNGFKLQIRFIVYILNECSWTFGHFGFCMYIFASESGVLSL